MRATGLTGARRPPGILFLHSSDEAYGSDRVLVQLVSAALGAGFAVRVLLPDDTCSGWLSDTLGKLDVAVRKGPLAPARRRYLSGRTIPAYLLSVRRARHFIRQEWLQFGPSVVHVNSTALWAMAVVRRPPGAKVVWHVHELVVSPAALALAFRLVPLLVAARVVAISDAVANHLRAMRIHHDRVVRIYNGVRPRQATVPGLNSEQGVVAVFAGRLSGWKGYDVFLDALARASGRVAGLTGFIAGTPPPGEEWRVDDVCRRIEESGLSATVKYLGFVEDMGSLFRPGRIIAVPSRWPEPFGLVTVEAMLVGCVVVASRHGGSVEIIEDGATGVLVPPGDAAALADAFVRLAGDADLRQRLGSAARRSAEERFSEQAFAESMAGLWNELAPR